MKPQPKPVTPANPNVSRLRDAMTTDQSESATEAKRIHDTRNATSTTPTAIEERP